MGVSCFRALCSLVQPRWLRNRHAITVMKKVKCLFYVRNGFDYVWLKIWILLWLPQLEDPNATQCLDVVKRWPSGPSKNPSHRGYCGPRRCVKPDAYQTLGGVNMGHKNRVLNQLRRSHVDAGADQHDCSQQYCAIHRWASEFCSSISLSGAMKIGQKCIKLP